MSTATSTRRRPREPHLAGPRHRLGPLHLGVRRRPRPPARPVPEGQGQAVGRAPAHRLGPGGRPVRPARHPRRGDDPVRHPALGRMTERDRGELRQHYAVLAVQPVPARRAGRDGLRGPDRGVGARPGRQVLLGHPDHGRGPARRDLRPLPAREDRDALPDQRQPPGPAGRHPARLPLGHALPRHAGPHRGPGAGRLRHDPRHHATSRCPSRSWPTSCRTRPATSPSAGWRCATTTSSSPTPSCASARSSSSRAAT